MRQRIVLERGRNELRPYILSVIRPTTRECAGGKPCPVVVLRIGYGQGLPLPWKSMVSEIDLQAIYLLCYNYAKAQSKPTETQGSIPCYAINTLDFLQPLSF